MSEDEIQGARECGACSEFQAEPLKPRASSRWFMLAMPLIFAYLAIIELLPTTRAGWVYLAMPFGCLAVVGAVAAMSRLY